MELGTIQSPTEIYKSAEGDHRLLAWGQIQAAGPELTYNEQLIVTPENYDPDPLGGGWTTDGFIQLDSAEAAAVRGAIDAFVGQPDEPVVNHQANHWFVEGDKSLLIEPVYDCRRSEIQRDGWDLSDEYGEAIHLSVTRLEWLAALAPQILASYKAANQQTAVEVANAD